MTFAKRTGLFALLAAGNVAACVLATNWASDYYMGRAQDTGRLTLSLVTEAVDQAVGRLAPVPGLIAGEPIFRQMLNQNSGTGVVPFVNEKLRQIALSVDASEVYVMDRTGRTIAASNYRDEDSFVGQNFSFRPYFTQSLAGQTAVFHALGTTSGERGFFFSAPILEGIDVVGVIAVKMTVGEMEQDWLDLGQDILIADSDGIVFLASNTDYRFGALAPLSDAVRQRIVASQQFPLTLISPIGISTNVVKTGAVQVEINETDGVQTYFADSAPLNLAGWHAIVFTPLQPVQFQVFRTVALVGFALAAVILTGLLLAQRRANVLQMIRLEQDQRALLEDRVRQRTTDLNVANISLKEEVAERRRAEERLRKSQKELIQAGKLAALGQMSAAISHEINQPLTAIKSYAVNAVEFLARSRVEDAKSNINSISKMTDRMTEISQHLRNFARQPGEALRPINVPDVISETIGLVGPQLRASKAKITFQPETSQIWALGGRLRLQQVLVNIISNALEAMSNQDTPIIEIDVRDHTDQVEIHVRDHGPGVPQESLEHLFDAFYTTKDAGSGMGLGMSISHNIISDFGGALSAGNHPDGGAVFTVTLQREDTPKDAGA